MKAAWDPTRLSVHHWDGAPPVAGDGIETGTGRRYLIERVVIAKGGKYAGQVRALECLVLPAGEPVPGELHRWSWSPRLRRY